MNVLWITADTFRRDHLGAYGNPDIFTPSLDSLAGKSVRFDNHYAGGFPTMPTRADHATGRWTASFMGWEPLPESETTLAEILSATGFHTAAVVDPPFYIREGMNYDKGFQTFIMHPGQDAPGVREPRRRHESVDVREAWRFESDRNAPQTFGAAVRWLERHHKEDFFLYVDTWDPHEPWDAPAYYTERYWPGYDGEIIDPLYAYWQDAPGFTEERVKKALATYRGEVGMVDTWIGYLLRHVENMGLMENTAVIFTSDHGFYFGEHGGLFGKMVFGRYTDGRLPRHGDKDATWGHSPLYEELVHIPLLVYMPGVSPGVRRQLTSAVDVMPTVLDILGHEIPESVEGRSLLPTLWDGEAPGREFVISTVPFSNPGDPIRSVDSLRRMMRASQVTTITAGGSSLLYSMDSGMSELFDLSADPTQQNNIIAAQPQLAKELHQYLLKFMRDTDAAPRFLRARQALRV